MAIPKLLSKTKLMRGYRCLKSIYLTVHAPSLEAPITPDIQALFDQGNAVGQAARTYFPNGELIDNVPWDFTGALAATREKMAQGAHTIYEAAFEYMGCYARADIIRYSQETNRWQIFEAKSTTKVKPEHLDDVGLQAWIIAKSGLLIEKIHILHLNPECRYPDLNNLFKEVDVTDHIRENYLSIKPKVAEIIQILRANEIPAIDIGPHCTTPTECGFKAHCWREKNIPEMSVFDLPNIRDKKWQLYNEGIISLNDARLTDLNALQERVIAAFKSGERFIDRNGICEAIAKWQYPLYFLDFETINPAIPRYVGCGPFHQVPFQFSVHVLTHPDAEITHRAFLHTDASDPRDSLIPALIDACGATGSIVAYYSTFESTRIQELANYAPQYAAQLSALLERIVDPLPIIRDYVYDPAFAGSFSLKKVAPALLGEKHSYDNMEIANGGAAQRAFELLISPKTSARQKENLIRDMLAYCEKDTLVMVELTKWLTEMAKLPHDVDVALEK